MAPEDANPLSATTPDDAVGASVPPPLDSRYTQSSGRVFMTGTQALVRMLLDQARKKGLGQTTPRLGTTGKP